jgi:CubicO group peptidase (beta-lactamase class C family)
LVCLGIHGQMVYVERSTRTVAVKLSSWPYAQHAAHLVDTIRAFDAVSAELRERSSTPEASVPSRRSVT